MAKIAFWITAGPNLEAKALAGLRLALRLKTVRHQDVQVFLYGPGLELAASDSPLVREALKTLREAEVAMGACPVNAKSLGISEDVVVGAGVGLRAAGEVLVELVDQGYQVIGI